MTRAKKAAADGFTLLEVMVSIAILAISLAAVFSTEAGAIRMAARARKMGFATLLARCKMGEVEEEIAIKGMPALFSEGNDECCEDAEINGFVCKWEIEPIIMPDTMFGTGEDEDGDPTTQADPVANAPPGANPASPDGLSGDPNELLNGGGDVDAITSMAMQFVYPVLKPSFESQIRRVTVTVTWNEGGAERSFDVTQYLVAEQPAGIGEVGADQAGGEGTTPAGDTRAIPGLPGGTPATGGGR